MLVDAAGREPGGLSGAQVDVDVARGFAALGDSPHDEALTAVGVAGAKHAVDVGGVGSVGLDVAARVEIDADLVDEARSSARS